MKLRFTLLLLALSFSLSACGKPDTPQSEDQKALTFEVTQMKADLLESTELDSEDLVEVENFEKVIESLKKQSHLPNITEEDLQRGWYYAEEDFKKYATPVSWVYQPAKGGKQGRWIHPDLVEKEEVDHEEGLCRRTSGTFIRSCNQLEVANQCQYIPQSTCECPKGSLWDASEGCLKVDEAGALVAISKKELEQGYYSGLSYQKKKGTPDSWRWNAEKAIWHSSHLLQI